MTEELSQPPRYARWCTFLAPALIVLAAVLYYGSYIQFWFNPHDEGGTAAFIAMRILEGEIPMRDVDLEYNILWFLPISGLFKLFGVNFILMRGYFFALSTVTALCGWGLARRVTRNEWIALGAGLALVFFPGSQFKNYIPLICIANTLCLVLAALATSNVPARFWRKTAAGGLVLGVSMLVRIDIAYLFVLMWLGLLAFRIFDSRLNAKARWLDGFAAAAVLCGGIILTHAPAFAVARARGFDAQFVQQYREKLALFAEEAGVTLPEPVARALSPDPKAESPAPADASAPAWEEEREPVREVSRQKLPRVSWADFRSFRKADTSVLFVLTYLPVLALLGLIGWAAFESIAAVFGGRFTMDHRSFVALLLIGGALTIFPQFFFFRPDRPHLSEFMPGFIVATVCVAAFLKAGPGRWITIGCLAVVFGLFGWFALDHYSAGTIAARTTIKRSKRVFFKGANGVRVYVHQREYAELEGVRRTIVANSKPGEWLVCYPYQPGYNVMADRPTCERDLYIDNATMSSQWNRRTIRRIQKKRPAVIVIDDRAINKVEASRFSHWAQPAYEYLQANYHRAGTFDTIEVYARDPVAESAPIKP